MKLLAYHNNPAIKDKYLARVEHHIKLDNLIRGEGWDGTRGCAVGCTLEAYDHSRYPAELGIPEWLAHVEDSLFEGMSEKKSRTWPRDFLAAIEPGVDLEKIKPAFMLCVLRRALATQEKNTAFDAEKFPFVAATIEQAKAAIKISIALWEGDSAAKSATWSALIAASAAKIAESAAESAADSAESAAESAASVKSAAWSAASAAESVKSAAWSAASAAESAAKSATDSAAESAEFDYLADELLKIIAALEAPLHMGNKAQTVGIQP